MEYYGSHVVDFLDKPPFVKPRFLSVVVVCSHYAAGNLLGLDGVYYSAIHGHTEYIYDKSSNDVVAQSYIPTSWVDDFSPSG